MSTEELCQLKDMDAYTAKQIVKNSGIILKNASNALDCQSARLQNGIVSQLLN